MATIFDIRDNVIDLKKEFPELVRNTLKESKPLIKSIVQDQLMAGVDEYGKPLTPSYLDDPYFKEKSKSEKQSRLLAKRYMNWKALLYPPQSTFLLGLRPRNIETPNLIITGMYHQSITPIITSDSIRIESQGFYAGNEIENKYGSKILGLTKEARAHLVKYRLIPAISKLLKDVGLR